ncbi:hypothetical protein SEA_TROGGLEHUMPER_112 [Rhodococcus phage Trogglehumper]|uniref:Uncharacterized protein n=1 Tax=Rhodococcus phage Trogglehumper TaxID=3038381 RepID=A0AAF0GNQ7_9CAUD|nr:hypothetical protein SEA_TROGGLEHUMPER_112 [Rhodococcus phage Trogglehumper]
MSETITQSRTITAPSGAEYRLEYVLEPDAENPYEYGDWMLAALVVAGDRRVIDVAHEGQSTANSAELHVFDQVQQYITRAGRSEYGRSERAVVRYLKLAGMQGITLVHRRNNGDYSTQPVDLDRLDLLGSDMNCHAAQADGFAWLGPTIAALNPGDTGAPWSELVAGVVATYASWAAGNAYGYRLIREEDEEVIEQSGTYYLDSEQAYIINEATDAAGEDDAERVREAAEEAEREAAEAEEAARDDAAHAAMIREEATRRADMRSAAIEYRRTVGALALEVADGAPGVADALDFADTMAALILEGK